MSPLLAQLDPHIVLRDRVNAEPLRGASRAQVDGRPG